MITAIATAAGEFRNLAITHHCPVPLAMVCAAPNGDKLQLISVVDRSQSVRAAQAGHHVPESRTVCEMDVVTFVVRNAREIDLPVKPNGGPHAVTLL
jgi:hypothetical protein